MTSERIKEIQQQTAYPDSVSVQQALLQVWNECSTPSQTEISDKEILYQKQVMNPYPSTEHLYTAWEKGFMECAKWYREQLKKK